MSLRLGKLGTSDSDGVAHEPDEDHARFTNDTDYNSACEALKQCLDETK